MVDNARGQVLVVDDDVAVGKVLVGLLRQASIEARHVPSGEQALAAFRSGSFDAVISDVQMPGMSGLELLRALKSEAPELPVIMLTAHGTVATAVEAMKAGATEFMTKPFDREEVLFTIDKALRLSASAPNDPPMPTSARTTLVGSSPKMKEVVELVSRAARVTAHVLIRGESGSGKEVAARTIHELSDRRGGPFIAVNCGALPEQLLESELFGYEKGAFTGASARKPGRVELASGGTLFLDEIGEAPLPVQVKLLRLLQEKQYERLGGTRTERADVRFIAATHRDLEELIESGEFREDLYYRLNVVPIWMPALRERPEDVVELASRFAAASQREPGRRPLSLSDAAKARLTSYAWPGNVRELSCVLERLSIFTDTDVADDADVEREIARQRGPAAGPRPAAAAAAADEVADETLSQRRLEAERKAVVEALTRAGQNRTLAARLLGVSRRTLYNRLAAFGIEA